VSTLESWSDGPARQAIVDFVAQARDQVPPAERVAVFDNDGTLWCEQPLPIQADFILRRLGEMAAADPGLRERQPWQAAHEQDAAWLSALMTEHYAGDDTKVKVLLGGILAAYAGMSVEEFERRSDTFLRTAQHPALGRPYLECAYRPMVELLAHLEANGFTNYIVSGGGRDFMRPVTDELYGVPRERVIGSTAALAYTNDNGGGGGGGTITHTPRPEYLDDGPEKPTRTWSRTGHRPLLATGNTNGDVEMLDFAEHADKPFLRLLVRHDDAEREFAYTAGAERALERAAAEDWTVVSVRDAWATVF
jgi:phosphoglycolate phosphatase-like HAD superfamily hydrolase